MQWVLRDSEEWPLCDQCQLNSTFEQTAFSPTDAHIMCTNGGFGFRGFTNINKFSFFLLLLFYFIFIIIIFSWGGIVVLTPSVDSE